MIDELTAVLTHEYRRALLLALCETSSIRPSDLFGTHGDSRRIHLELHHAHLPMLEEYSLVRWDRETNRVARGPRFDRVEPLLDPFVDRIERAPAD